MSIYGNKANDGGLQREVTSQTERLLLSQDTIDRHTERGITALFPIQASPPDIIPPSSAILLFCNGLECRYGGVLY